MKTTAPPDSILTQVPASSEAQFDRLALLEEENKKLQEENSQLHMYIRQLRHRQFGPKSEKLQSNQDFLPLLNLFDEPRVEETEPETTEFVDDTIVVEKQSRKKRGRRPLPDNLPRTQIIHDLTEDEKQCDCGHSLSKIGEETSQQLEYIPAQVKVLEHVRYKYACRACEEGVKLAPLPVQPIPKSIATPGLLANVLVSKYNDHLPLYRQSAMWSRLGIDLSRGTMCQWVLKCGDLLAPLVDLLKADIVNGDYVLADETRVQVLSESGREATSKSQMWVFMTGASDKPSIVYQYDPSRAGQVAEDFLSGFEGHLQSDAYSGYNAVSKKKKVIRVGCMAHARRKFVEITKLVKKQGKAHEAVEFIGKLYAIERYAKQKSLPPDKVKALREEKSKPILDEFKAWLEKHVGRAPPKHPLGRAMKYCLNNWVALTRYVEDGRLDIDNNACERAIRPFAVGRKNWIFMGNQRGARAGAVIYSLIETCKVNDVEPYAYLRHVLKHIPTTDNLVELLPYNLKEILDQGEDFFSNDLENEIHYSYINHI